jgi:two-component system osmolarity sensor histidine kinase EnvZ
MHKKAQRQLRRKFSLKRLLPSSLFYRALLILLLPVILIQVLAAYFFFERHWDSVQRNMSSAMAGEVGLLLATYQRSPVEGNLTYVQEQAENMGLRVAVVPPVTREFRSGYGERAYRTFYRNLRDRIAFPVRVFSIHGGRDVRISLKLKNGSVFQVEASRKRLASNTTRVFVLWMIGSTLLLTAVAIVFLRNQVRPITQLARAAERFGLGQDAEGFSPSGAAEVRAAGRAFLIMRERLRRQLMTRTEMLAGISHDLRTPLTRMQLQIAMAPLHEAQKKTLEDDITEMRHMIQEYLDFARGDVAEPAESCDLSALAKEVVEGYTRSGKPVYLQYALSEPLLLQLRPQALRRCLANLIDNALRYGQRAVVSIEPSAAFARIKVEDAGPGIPEEAQEEVFKPFTRLDASRNSKTGGVGLGLSIARDIAHSHGGEIFLVNLRDGEGSIRGLEVTLRLPREIR